MKSLHEIDLEDWEFLPEEGFLEIHNDGGKKIYSRNYARKSVFYTNYFICPTKESEQIPYEVKIVTPPSSSEKIMKLGSDLDPVSQVFFKKMEENQFVDMKMDSPKSSSGIFHQIEGANLQFEESDEVKSSDLEELDLIHSDKTGKGGSSNVWKWSLSGVAAICSFGVAVCIMVLTKQSKKKQFHIYTDEKRMKKVVERATKLNEAISALRGVPLTRAHITIGGYYDATETTIAAI